MIEVILSPPGTRASSPGNFNVAGTESTMSSSGSCGQMGGGLLTLLHLDSWMNVFYLLGKLNCIMVVGSAYILHLEGQRHSPLRVSFLCWQLYALRGHSDGLSGWQLMNNVCVRTSGHVPTISPASSGNGPLLLRWCYMRFYDEKSEIVSHQMVVAKVLWERMGNNTQTCINSCKPKLLPTPG